MGVKKVLVFGGGVGGLSAAHELTEGARAAHFDVTVVEAGTVYGGKARSESVTGIPAGAKPYPGEHGFRFFPTFYRHVIDTMQRIPSAYQGRHSVADHLHSTPLRMLARYGHPPIIMPSAPSPFDLGHLLQFVQELFGADTGLSFQDLWFFAKKLLQIATSCKARRLAEYETQSWWDFVDAASRSVHFQHYLANGLTRTLVAAKPNEINAMTGGDVLVRILVDSGMIEIPASADRVLDGPTSKVWIDQWLVELQKRAVTFRQGTQLLSLNLAGDAVTGAVVRNPDGTQATLTADYYVIALPVEKVADVLDQSIAVRDAGERLSGIATLRGDVRSMTGAQFYLDRPLNIESDMGHALYIDTEWALTSIAQSNFWRAPFDDLTQWGNGDIKTIWSTILSDWTTAYPSGGGGATADRSTLDQLRAGTIAQLVASLNGDGVQRFDPSTVVAWNLDSAVTAGDASQDAVNQMQLLVNKPSRWQFRPDAAPQGVANLMLASDYVRTNTDLATMEGANEAARRAVNAILTLEGVGDLCAIYELYYPEVLTGDATWKGWLDFDEKRFQAGQSWQLPILGFDARAVPSS